MLKIENIFKTYKGKKALQKFSYHFNEGIYAIHGKSGAGKSTLLHLISGSVSSSGGHIFYKGTDIVQLGSSFRRLIGYMPQQQCIYKGFSARMFLYYMAELKGISKRKAVPQIEQLLHVANLMEEADRKLDHFSVGKIRRVLLAQTLLGTPRILLWDEPTAGMNEKEKVYLQNYIPQISKGKLILYTSREPDCLAGTAGHILTLEEGMLAADAAR